MKSRKQHLTKDNRRVLSWIITHLNRIGNQQIIPVPCMVRRGHSPCALRLMKWGLNVESWLIKALTILTPNLTINHWAATNQNSNQSVSHSVKSHVLLSVISLFIGGKRSRTLVFPTTHGSRGKFWAQAGYATFGREVQMLISAPSYGETELLSRRTSLSVSSCWKLP